MLGRSSYGTISGKIGESLVDKIVGSTLINKHNEYFEKRKK